MVVVRDDGAGGRAAHAVIPLRYDPRDFEGTFVVTNNVEPRQADEPVPRRVLAWTGENPLTPNRVDSLEAMKRMVRSRRGLLVTPRDLPEWEVLDAPFHPVVGALSYIHRADYFRAYFLHHHGGGYADLKRPTHDWNGVFDRMDAGDSWMAGYRVPVRLMTPNMDDPRLETSVQPSSLVLPVFVRENATEPRPIASMPGVVQHSRDSLRAAVAEAAELGLGGVMLFGIPETKDATGSGGIDPAGVLNLAITDVVAEVGDQLTVMSRPLPRRVHRPRSLRTAHARR